MSEDILFEGMSDDSFGADAGMTREDAKEATEGNLVKRGRWEGQLQPDSKITTVETSEGKHPLENEKIARCHVILATDEGDKHFFFDALPKLVKLTSERTGGTYTVEASSNAGFLYEATKMYGQPFPAVLKHAMEHRLVYAIGVKKATDQYPAKNNLRGVYAVKSE